MAEYGENRGAGDSNRSRSKTILAIDGGGARIVVPMTALVQVEESEPALLSGFDFLAGTSAGALIALALAQGISMTRLSQFIGEAMDYAAQHRRRWMVVIRSLTQPVFPSPLLEAGLRDLFGDAEMSDLLVPVIVPTFSLETLSPHIFSSVPILGATYSRAKVWRVARCALALPAAVSPWRERRDLTLVDGGIAWLNPSALALAEASRHFMLPMSRFRLLSLGSGAAAVRPDPAKAPNAGQLFWLRNGFRVYRGAQCMAAHYLASRLAGATNITRLDLPVPSPHDSGRRYRENLASFAEANSDTLATAIARWIQAQREMMLPPGEAEPPLNELDRRP